MKRILFFLTLFSVFFIAEAQTVFWNETFTNGCTSGCLTYSGPNGAWNMNVSTGSNPFGYNKWFVSCAEDGKAAGICSTGCGSDPSLHIGADDGVFFDPGAAYDAAQVTNMRSESPDINTTPAGANAITLRFNFIQFGQGVTDRCQLYYSINGGAAWIVLENPIPKAVCCGGACNGQRQGQWTARSYVLPGTCNNIVNFKVAFNWINDVSGGTDPSFAVDDITLEYTAPLPVTFLSFTGEKNGNAVNLYWTTASETNNDYFEIQRSSDALSYASVGQVKGSGNSNGVLNYSFIDNKLETGVVYYRIKQVDFNGDYQFSGLIAVNLDSDGYEIILVENNLVTDVFLASIYTPVSESYSIQISDASGKLVHSSRETFVKGINKFQFNTTSLSNGVYFFHLINNQNKIESPVYKFVKM